jgi:glutamine synthetase
MAIRENFTYTDMDLWLNEKRVTEIECLVPDLTGVARGKILPRANSRRSAACASRKRCWA